MHGGTLGGDVGSVSDLEFHISRREEQILYSGHQEPE